MTDDMARNTITIMPHPKIEQELAHLSIQCTQEKEGSSDQESIDKPSPLLTLPPELRSCIYSHLVPTGEILEFDHTWLYHINWKDEMALVTSHSTEDAPDSANIATLTSICHLIRIEVLDHYYGRNTFVLAENNQGTHLERWLRRKSPAAYRSLKRVMIEHWRTCDAEPRSGKEECLRRLLVNLETLELRAVRDAGGHEGAWSCGECAVKAEMWPGQVRKDVDFESLRKGWDFEAIAARKVEGLIVVVKDIGDSSGNS